MTSLRDDLNDINNAGLKSKFVDYEMVYGKVSDTFTIVTIPKTSNTITRSTITSDNSEDSSYTYTFDPISNDTYFYVIRASYNSSNSSTPFTIDDISVINGTVEQVGEGYTVTIPYVPYGDRYSSYSLFRVKGNENCIVTIPSTRATNGVKLVEFTL